jgi:hypothetical protein
MADLIGLDFKSQFVIGFVAVCVEGLLQHMKGRNANSNLGELGINILTLSDVGEDGVFVFVAAGGDGNDRIKPVFGGVIYIACHMWIGALVMHGVAPFAGMNDAAALQLKVLLPSLPPSFLPFPAPSFFPSLCLSSRLFLFPYFLLPASYFPFSTSYFLFYISYFPIPISLFPGPYFVCSSFLRSCLPSCLPSVGPAFSSIFVPVLPLTLLPTTLPVL